MFATMGLNVDMKSSENDAALTVGEVAERFGLATHVLRHWESLGLLSPARTTGDRRRYTTRDVYRVAVILRAKEAGLALDDIRELITAEDPATRNDILRRHHADLVQRIAAARASLALIECALDCDHEDIADCAHFQAAVADRINATNHEPRRSRQVPLAAPRRQ
jgi:MerR family copper efflux transcriptional regulator